MKMTLADIAAVLGLPAPEAGATLAVGAAIDSRKIHPGEIFVCVRGEKVDGHDYAAAAVQAGPWPCWQSGRWMCPRMFLWCPTP